jgi:glycine oxidase
VPRRIGGVLVLGRAAPDAGSVRPAAGRVEALLGEARRLVPASAGWGLVEAGTAREHAAPDGVPVLGETATPGLFLAAGWGCDELLLTPAAAAVAADLVTGQSPALASAPFAPGRLGA